MLQEKLEAAAAKVTAEDTNNCRDQRTLSKTLKAFFSPPTKSSLSLKNRN